MLFDMTRKRVLAAVLTGLCLSGCVSTTPFDPFGRRQPAPVVTLPAPAPLPGQQQPQAVIPPIEENTGSVLIPLPPGDGQAGLPPVGAAGSAGTVRVALLLPLRSQALSRAATAVREGFMAAHAADRRNIIVTVAETGDNPQEILSAYDAASASADIIVGPLSRSAATAMVQTNAARKPTISLAHPDVPAGMTVSPQPGMLFAALSVEDEARQIADRIAAENPRAKVFALSTLTAWQRRAAKAFSTQAEAKGLQTENVEINLVSGFLDGAGLAELRKQLRAEDPAMVFVALDFEQTRQLRAAIGPDVPLFGTSQLNPLAMTDWAMTEPLNFMNGTQLLDIPWQLQKDHPAVMAYPRPAASPDVRRSADVERLYALGIDAYRIASNLASRNARFEIDGVTGRLKVDYSAQPPSFQRRMTPAVYRDGTVVPQSGTR